MVEPRKRLQGRTRGDGEARRGSTRQTRTPSFNPTVLVATYAIVFSRAAMGQQQQVIRIGFTSPFSQNGAEAADCPTCAAAFLSAIKWINNNAATALGSGSYTVQGKMMDTSTTSKNVQGSDLLLADRYCNGGSGCGGSVNVNGENVMALVGGRFSRKSVLTAAIAEMHSKPMVSFASTADVLSNKTAFPFFSRVVGPDRNQANAMVAVIRSFGWSRIGVLSANEEYGANFQLQLTTAAEANGITIEARTSFDHQASAKEIELPIRLIKETGVRVIILASTDTDVANVFRAAEAVGAVGPGFTWIGPDGVSNARNFVGSSTHVGRAARGFLGLFPQYANPRLSPPGSLAAIAYRDIFVEPTWTAQAATVAPDLDLSSVTRPPFDSWGYYVWDATIFVAKACAAAFYSCRSPMSNASNNSFIDGECVQAFIRNSSLHDGATGDIVLNAVGDRPASYNVLNLNLDDAAVLVPVGNVSVEGDGDNAVLITREAIVWSDGSQEVPSDGDFTSSSSSSSTNEDSVIAGLVLLSGALFAAFAVGVAFYRHRLRVAQSRPENLVYLQNEILEAKMGTTLNVTPSEIGFTLHLDKPFDEESDDSAGIIEAEILRVARQLSGLPRRFAAMLHDDYAKVIVKTGEQTLMLVLPRPRKLRMAEVEDFAAILSQHAAARNFVVGSHAVMDVAVTMSIREPAEIDRTRLTRLEVLGEGHFAEVFKARLAPVKSNFFEITVAAKSLKSMAVTDGNQRAQLLKEAALVALFEHRNIVRVVGVVTIPRNIPPLLLLEYCEGGTLLDVIQQNDPSTIDIQESLTFCYDVCCGMHYLSSRQIVHRDLAARNVLIDSSGTCKVTDFGMATALTGVEDEYTNYATNYVKMHGDLPIRWSAIEVLQESKFSRASDVWSFGVLTYEILSGGRTPYAEVRTLIEAAEHIKAGHVLQRPPDCPPLVYENLMLPCWISHPHNRPGFRQLRNVLLDLGVVPTADDFTESESEKRGARRRRGRKNTKKSCQIDVDEWSLRGASIHHLEAVLAPEVYSMVDRRYATITDAVNSVVGPTSAKVVCPRDGMVGCAYVDLLLYPDDVGHSTALLSYTWGYRFSSVVNALQQWSQQAKRNPKCTYIWICSLCLNQHRMVAPKTPSELASEFGPRLKAIGRILPMLEPWQNPLYLTRAWCLFEFYTAILERKHIDIEIIITEDERRSFLTAMNEEGHAAIDAAFQNIKSEEATAREPADLNAIRELVQSRPGGFEVLNQMCRKHLERWFQNQGAVKSAPRMWRKAARKALREKSHSLSVTIPTSHQIVELPSEASKVVNPVARAKSFELLII